MQLSQLLDPKIFTSLSPDDLERLEAVLESEIARNPDIQKALKTRLEAFVPHLKKDISKP
jgi:hypothetical protein